VLKIGQKETKDIAKSGRVFLEHTVYHLDIYQTKMDVGLWY